MEEFTTFIAMYRGVSIGDAKMVAVSADPCIVADVAARLLGIESNAPVDRALLKLDQGRRGALRVIRQEAKGAVGNARTR